MEKSKKQIIKPIILTGLKACLETFNKRPDAILKVYFLPDAISLKSPLVIKKGRFQPELIKRVSELELKKITGGLNHEGVACSILPPQVLDENQLPLNEKFFLALDHISNPHNYGTIFRICSFFNIQNVIQEISMNQAKPSGAAMRVSQGGIEHVNIFGVKSLPEQLKNLQKKGYKIIGTSLSSRSKDFRLVEKVPMVLVLGNEEEGLRPEIQKICDELIIIKRKGSMESLNVAVATGILCNHFYG